VLNRIIGYDENKKTKEVIYRGYEGTIPATSLSFYDSVGNEILNYYRIEGSPFDGKLIKTLSYYNENNKLVKTISYGFEKRIRKDVDKGFGRPGGCIILPEDYEKNKTWALEKVWNYRYDKKNRLVEKYLIVGGDTQNRYVYHYDSNDGLIEERLFSQNELVGIDSYKRYHGGFEYTTTSYDNGKRKKDWNDKEYGVDTFRYKTDKFGNITQELVIEDGGRQVSRHKKYYDEKNRMVREEIYDTNDKLLGIYKHIYETNINPTHKIFNVNSE
jgi:hypothetical protein